MISAMTGRNITQRMMSSSWRLPLDAHDALADPFLHIIRHPGPIEAMGQSSQGSVMTQMDSKQRSMVWPEKFLPAVVKTSVFYKNGEALQKSARGHYATPQQYVQGNIRQPLNKKGPSSVPLWTRDQKVCRFCGVAVTKHPPLWIGGNSLCPGCVAAPIPTRQFL